MKRSLGGQPGTIRCICGGTFNAGESCQRCSGDGAPVQQALPKPAEVVCTHEENMAGLAALKAAVFGKAGPMAKEIDRVIARLNVGVAKDEAETRVPF